MPPSSYLSLERNPTEIECKSVGLRYIEYLGCQIPSNIAAHVSDFIAWEICRPRNAGSLDWTDECLNWKWADLSSLSKKMGQTEPECHVFQLSRLTSTRINAWMEITLSKFGPTSRVSERTEQDWITARERYNAAQSLDIEAFKSNLEHAILLEIGPDALNQLAAQRLVERLVNQQKNYKSRSVDDFYNEVSSFMQDKFEIEVEQCTECSRQGNTVKHIAPTETSLPPFHILCECKVRWKHSWIFSEQERNASVLDSEINSWVLNNIQGTSIRPPSLRDLLNFENARLQDEINAKNSPANIEANKNPTGIFSRILAKLLKNNNYP